ncbi:hypothetical protein NMY22_g15654 [Coprinellus aureogranulatus]|nr:hypothetical protein NMY22_g15654 [Coprinellus aureogranulatus]
MASKSKQKYKSSTTVDDDVDMDDHAQDRSELLTPYASPKSPRFLPNDPEARWSKVLSDEMFDASPERSRRSARSSSVDASPNRARMGVPPSFAQLRDDSTGRRPHAATPNTSAPHNDNPPPSARPSNIRHKLSESDFVRAPGTIVGTDEVSLHLSHVAEVVS